MLGRPDLYKKKAALIGIVKVNVCNTILLEQVWKEVSPFVLFQ